MTIDEAIQRENKIVEENQKIVDTEIVFDDVSLSQLYCDDTEVIEEHLENYKKCAEYHEQIVEWLKELKMYKSLAPRELVSEKQKNDRSIEYSKGFDYGFNIGHNKAIDDFAGRLIEELSHTTLVEDGYYLANIIKPLAEQLKVGGENE